MSEGSDGATPMTTNRPYLLRAIYDWVVDNNLTPYVLIDASVEGVEVPPQTIKDGRVVLNLSMQAVSDLDLGNEYVSCKARFSGASHVVMLPIAAIMAVYAQENGQGMMFAGESNDHPPSSPPSGDSTPPRRIGRADKAGKRAAPHLKVVK